MPKPADARRRKALADLEKAVVSRGGVARVSTLQAIGHSRHYVRLAIDSAALVHVCRDWVALPRADAQLVSAAKRGVVVSCVSQARRLGLWVLSGEGEHVAIGHGGRVAPASDLRVHRDRPVVARVPDVLVDSVENMLALVATCQPHDAALAVWESAWHQGHVEPRRLERLRLPPAARRLLAEMQPFADSGLETIFTTRLRWLNLPIRTQIWIAGHRVDHLIGDRLVVQIDGGHHVDGQRITDNKHDAALRLLGYTVIRVGYAQIVDDWASVQWLIMQAVAQGLHHAAPQRRQ